MLQRLLGYFVRGLLVLAPVAVTVWIFWIVFRTIDRWIDLEPWIGRHLPGLGFLITILLVLAVGFLASNIAGRWLFGEADRLLAKLPLVKLLYTSMKDLINAFVGEHKRFDKPVLVDVGGFEVFGFVTREALADFPDDSGEDRGAYCAVYVPQSYNFAGNLIVVPSKTVKRVDAESTSVMALIVSGGVAGNPGAAAGQGLPAGK